VVDFARRLPQQLLLPGEHRGFSGELRLANLRQAPRDRLEARSDLLTSREGVEGPRDLLREAAYAGIVREGAEHRLRLGQSRDDPVELGHLEVEERVIPEEVALVGGVERADQVASPAQGDGEAPGGVGGQPVAGGTHDDQARFLVVGEGLAEGLVALAKGSVLVDELARVGVHPHVERRVRARSQRGAQRQGDHEPMPRDREAHPTSEPAPAGRRQPSSHPCRLRVGADSNLHSAASLAQMATPAAHITLPLPEARILLACAPRARPEGAS